MVCGAALRDGRLHVIMLGIFLLVFGRKYVESMEEMGNVWGGKCSGDRLHSARTTWCLITRKERMKASGIEKGL